MMHSHGTFGVKVPGPRMIGRPEKQLVLKRLRKKTGGATSRIKPLRGLPSRAKANRPILGPL